MPLGRGWTFDLFNGPLTSHANVMFIGYFGLGFGTKTVQPRVSLGTLFLASQFADLLWPNLLLLGLEQVRVMPGLMVVSPFDFVHYPFSHSLAMDILWGMLLGLGPQRERVQQHVGQRASSSKVDGAAEVQVEVRVAGSGHHQRPQALDGGDGHAGIGVADRGGGVEPDGLAQGGHIGPVLAGHPQQHIQG